MKKENRTVQFIFILIFLTIFSFSVGNAFAQVRTEKEKSNEWREIHFNFGNLEPPFFNWCGQGKQMVLGGKAGKGLRLLDLDTGNLHDLTTDVRHKYPSCSSDGRYIFFTDSSERNYKNLYFYDFETKKITLIYTLDKPLPIQVINDPLSPSGKYLIGPANWKDKVTLPGGEVVTVVPIHGTVEVGKPPKFFNSEWSFDGNKLFLHNLNNQTIFIKDLGTGNQISIQIRIKGFQWAKDIKSSPDNKKLYFRVFFGSEHSGGIVHLYELDLIKSKAIPRVLVKNIDYFNVSHDNSIIFSRSHGGYDYLYIYYGDAKIKLIKKFRSSTWHIRPHISNDGNAIAFFQILENNEKAITVLMKENK